MCKTLGFMALCLFLTFQVQAASPSAAAGKNIDTARSAVKERHSTPEFEIVVDPDFASPANWKELHRRIQEQNRKYYEARGGVDLGGAASIIDPKTGKRRLLDLVEPDDWTYVDYIPVSPAYIDKLSSNLAQDIDAFYFNSLWNFTGPDKALNHKMELLMGLAWAALVDINSPGIKPGFWSFREFLRRSGFNQLEAALDDRAEQYGRIVRWVFVDFPLENLNDEGFIRLIDPSTKRQVAIQKDGIVIIQRGEYKLLDDESQAAVFAHESVLFSLLTLKPEIIANQGTAPVRKIVRRLFAYQRVYYKAVGTPGSVDVATLTNYHRAVEDAVRELVNLGF